MTPTTVSTDTQFRVGDAVKPNMETLSIAEGDHALKTINYQRVTIGVFSVDGTKVSLCRTNGAVVEHIVNKVLCPFWIEWKHLLPA